jgi:hypothetical protein
MTELPFASQEGLRSTELAYYYYYYYYLCLFSCLFVCLLSPLMRFSPAIFCNLYVALYCVCP